MPDGGDGGADLRAQPEDADRRAAQDAAGELLRMGIDPGALGLDPIAHEQNMSRVYGVASVPVQGRPEPEQVSATPEPAYPAEPAYAPAPPLPAWHNTWGWHPPVVEERPGDKHDPNAAVRSWFDPVVDSGTTQSVDSDALNPAPVWPPAPAQNVPAQPRSSLRRPLGDQRGTGGVMPAANREGVAEPLDRLADGYGTVVPAPWRRGIRAITFGVLQPGAAEAIEIERQLVARVKARRREPCIVAFVAGKGGMGTTTTAGGVALTLATLRTDDTTILDVHHGVASLGVRLAGQPAPTVPQLFETVGPDSPSVNPLRVHGALGVLDGTPWHSPVPRNQLLQALELLRDSNAFTLVDVGNDTSEAGHGALARADQVVVVTTASADAVQSTRIALSRVHQVDPHRLDTIVVAVACLNTRQYRRTIARLRDEFGLAERRLVPVPFDPALASGDRLDLARARPATREAYLRLAGFVADPGKADNGTLSRRSAIDSTTTCLPLATRSRQPSEAGR